MSVGVRTGPAAVVRLAFWVCGLAAAVLLTACDESLPPRLVPEDPLQFAHVIANQGTGPGGIFVTVAVDVENVYQETFEGQLDMEGEVHIWWRDRPEVEAHLPLADTRTLRIDPGERYRTEAQWFLQTDDGRDVLGLLNFGTGDIRFGVLYARPEVFVVEVNLTMFSEAGLRISGRREFTLQGWRLLEDPDAPTLEP